MRQHLSRSIIPVQTLTLKNNKVEFSHRPAFHSKAPRQGLPNKILPYLRAFFKWIALPSAIAATVMLSGGILPLVTAGSSAVAAFFIMATGISVVLNILLQLGQMALRYYQ